MMKNKKFDCVKMKWQIQQKMQQEYENMTDEQAHQLKMKKVFENPVLGKFIERIQKADLHKQR